MEWGLFSFVDSIPGVAAALAAGLDWVCLDGQHGRWDDARVLAALDALPAEPGRVLVRVRSLDAGLIGRALDAGARGVVVPMVESAEQARAAVAAVRYPPSGSRSFGPIRAPYGAPSDTAAANAANLCAVMIETAAALDAVEVIAAVPGVDLLFVGPFDLSLALGTDVDSLLAEDDGPLTRVVAAAAATGIRAGAFAGTPDRARRMAALGFTLIAATSDTDVVERGLSSVVAQLS
ncbi:MAG: aldolase/citrate lyase family protein [Lapillicoccus sp.]